MASIIKLTFIYIHAHSHHWTVSWVTIDWWCDGGDLWLGCKTFQNFLLEIWISGSSDSVFSHDFKYTCSWKIIKSSSDPKHFIFEINVGKRWIRHETTLKLNDDIFNRFWVDLEIPNSESFYVVNFPKFNFLIGLHPTCGSWQIKPSPKTWHSSMAQLIFSHWWSIVGQDSTSIHSFKSSQNAPLSSELQKVPSPHVMTLHVGSHHSTSSVWTGLQIKIDLLENIYLLMLKNICCC